MEYKYIIIFMAILFSFWWGKKLGQKKGEEEGIKRTALTYKKKALDEGKCSICGYALKEKKMIQDKK